MCLFVGTMETSANPVETEMETGLNWDRSWTTVSETNENL